MKPWRTQTADGLSVSQADKCAADLQIKWKSSPVASFFFFFVSRAISLCMSLNRTGIFEDDNKWHRREDFGITHWAEHNALPTLFKAVVTDVQVSRERFWPMTEGLRFYNHQQQPGARTHTRTHREEGWAWTRPCLPQNVVKDFIKQHVKWTVLRDILQLKSKLWWIKPRSPDSFLLSFLFFDRMARRIWLEREREKTVANSKGPQSGIEHWTLCGIRWWWPCRCTTQPRFLS